MLIAFFSAAVSAPDVVLSVEVSWLGCGVGPSGEGGGEVGGGREEEKQRAASFSSVSRSPAFVSFSFSSSPFLLFVLS